jgi:hypothetical protein
VDRIAARQLDPYTAAASLLDRAIGGQPYDRSKASASAEATADRRIPGDGR